MNLNEWSKEIHAVAVAHGWWEKAPSFGEIVALCHSELSEALEEHRNGNKPSETYFTCVIANCGNCFLDNSPCLGEDGIIPVCVDGTPNKPEGVAVEMADCLIRILDWCGHEGIDIEAIVALKTEYNKTRPYRHGGKAL